MRAAAAPSTSSLSRASKPLSHSTAVCSITRCSARAMRQPTLSKPRWETYYDRPAERRRHGARAGCRRDHRVHGGQRGGGRGLAGLRPPRAACAPCSASKPSTSGHRHHGGRRRQAVTSRCAWTCTTAMCCPTWPPAAPGHRRGAWPARSACRCPRWTCTSTASSSPRRRWRAAMAAKRHERTHRAPLSASQVLYTSEMTGKSPSELLDCGLCLVARESPAGGRSPRGRVGRKRTGRCPNTPWRSCAAWRRTGRHRQAY